jgi:hypothetical protein
MIWRSGWGHGGALVAVKLMSRVDGSKVNIRRGRASLYTCSSLKTSSMIVDVAELGVVGK